MTERDATRLLFLDDEEWRYKWLAAHSTPDTVLHWVRTVPEAIAALEAEAWDQIWLDHDLGTEPAVGRDVATWLAQHPEVTADLIVVHSVNTVSAPKILRELLASGRAAIRRPFDQMTGAHFIGQAPPQSA